MSARKKGLSHEDKRAKLLELMHEKREFFQLKDLEKLGAKEKGIVSQSVKDVLQSLVDDGLVDSEKIGTLTCFWAFPSKALATRKRKITFYTDDIVGMEKRAAELRELISEASLGKEDSANRTQVEQFVRKVEEENITVMAELERCQTSNAEHANNLKKATEDACQAANRWTDNVFSIKTWCAKKFNVEESVMDKQFAIPDDFDYVEC